jgi:hypothetical protein
MTDTLQSGTGGDLKDTAQQKAQEVAGQAKEKAMGVAAPAAQGLKTQIDTRTTSVGEGVTGLADVARMAGDEMRQKGQDGPAQYADRAAEYVERLGGYLRDADPDRMLKDVEGVARKQPALVAGGGLILGFLAARFLRASSQGRSGVDQSYRGEYTPTSQLSSGYAEADRSFREVGGGADRGGSRLDRHGGTTSAPAGCGHAGRDGRRLRRRRRPRHHGRAARRHRPVGHATPIPRSVHEHDDPGAPSRRRRRPVAVTDAAPTSRARSCARRRSAS